VTGGPDLSLIEVSEASSIIHEAAHEEANIIFGAVVDPRMEGRVKITVIATGFDRETAPRAERAAAQTPVDLQQYATWREAPAERAVSGARLGLGRRQGVELPVGVAIGGGLETATAVETPLDEVEDSPLDIPAFLRRQNE
jgi:cell division protein FtsZ